LNERRKGDLTDLIEAPSWWNLDVAVTPYSCCELRELIRLSFGKESEQAGFERGIDGEIHYNLNQLIIANLSPRRTSYKREKISILPLSE
jgi:hypothetical protein